KVRYNSPGPGSAEVASGVCCYTTEPSIPDVSCGPSDLSTSPIIPDSPPPLLPLHCEARETIRLGSSITSAVPSPFVGRCRSDRGDIVIPGAKSIVYLPEHTTTGSMRTLAADHPNTGIKTIVIGRPSGEVRSLEPGVDLSHQPSVRLAAPAVLVASACVPASVGVCMLDGSSLTRIPAVTTFLRPTPLPPCDSGTPACLHAASSAGHRALLGWPCCSNAPVAKPALSRRDDIRQPISHADPAHSLDTLAADPKTAHPSSASDSFSHTSTQPMPEPADPPRLLATCLEPILQPQGALVAISRPAFPSNNKQSLPTPLPLSVQPRLASSCIVGMREPPDGAAIPAQIEKHAGSVDDESGYLESGNLITGTVRMRQSHQLNKLDPYPYQHNYFSGTLDHRICPITCRLSSYGQMQEDEIVEPECGVAATKRTASQSSNEFSPKKSRIRHLVPSEHSAFLPVCRSSFPPSLAPAVCSISQRQQSTMNIHSPITVPARSPALQSHCYRRDNHYINPLCETLSLHSSTSDYDGIKVTGSNDIFSGQVADQKMIDINHIALTANVQPGTRDLFGSRSPEH
ncbi:unnamed protein product, partial [Protopolystoma xenopodis]